MLDLSHNNLEGEIPAEFGRLLHLRDLRLNQNQLSGPIPPSLGAQCVRLRHLDVSDNLLTGPIPDEIAMMTELRILNLQQNQLSGYDDFSSICMLVCVFLFVLFFFLLCSLFVFVCLSVGFFFVSFWGWLACLLAFACCSYVWIVRREADLHGLRGCVYRIVRHGMPTTYRY